MPTSEKPMSAIKYDLRVMTEKEFRKKYKGTPHASYLMLLEYDAKGFLD